MKYTCIFTPWVTKKHVLVSMEPKYKKLRLNVYKLDTPFKGLVPELLTGLACSRIFA